MTRVKIRDVVISNTGSINPTKSPTETFVYVDVAAVDNTNKVITSAREILGADAPSRARKLIRKGDILVSTVRPNLNAVAMVPSYLDGQIASTGFCVLRTSEKVLSEYLYFYARSDAFVESLSSLVAGAMYPAVTDSQVLDQNLPLPNIQEQRRIVDLLSRAEGIVRRRREAEKKAAELIPALFLDMFGDPAMNPKGWETKKLGEICRIIGGSSLPAGEPYSGQEQGLLLMKVSDMNSPGNEVFISSCKEWIPEQKRTYSSVTEGTIVFPKRGAAIATNKKRIVSRSLLLDPNLMGVLPDQIIVSTDYLFQWFSAFDLADISSGTTVPQLNKGDLTPLVIPIPPMSMQRKFAEKRAAVMSIQAQQATAIIKAQAAFDALLGKAFSDG